MSGVGSDDQKDLQAGRDEVARPGDVMRPALDAVVRGLQELRLDTGVSYAEIATRIGARRAAEGHSPGSARVARSTVFDAFQPGRQRLNAELVREIALALGCDEGQATHWRDRCLAARRADSSHRSAAGTAPESELASPAAGQDSDSDHGVPEATASTHALHVAFVVVVLVGCVGFNLFGGAFVARLHLPLFFDMAGTATAAFLLGPWCGALVGVGTNALGAFTAAPEGIPFALVNVAGALVWGYGMRTFARTVPRFLLLGALAGLVCTLVSLPIHVLLYDGASGHGLDGYIAMLRGSDGLWGAVLLANLPASIVDKLVAALAGLALARLLTPLHFAVASHAKAPALLRSAAAPGPARPSGR